MEPFPGPTTTARDIGRYIISSTLQPEYFYKGLHMKLFPGPTTTARDIRRYIISSMLRTIITSTL